MSEDPKLAHRKQQLHNIMELIESVQEEVRTAVNHNSMLTKRKNELESEMSTYDMRLQSILKEKELLFSRLMTVEREL